MARQIPKVNTFQLWGGFDLRYVQESADTSSRGWDFITHTRCWVVFNRLKNVGISNKIAVAQSLSRSNSATITDS